MTEKTAIANIQYSVILIHGIRISPAARRLNWIRQLILLLSLEERLIALRRYLPSKAQQTSTIACSYRLLPSVIIQLTRLMISYSALFSLLRYVENTIFRDRCWRRTYLLSILSTSSADRKVHPFPTSILLTSILFTVLSDLLNISIDYVCSLFSLSSEYFDISFLIHDTYLGT